MSKFVSVLFSPFGTVGRKHYWLGLAFVFILFFLIFIASDFQDFLLAQGLGVVRVPIMLVMIWSVFVLAVKRLRDAGKNPLWIIILFIPAINFLAMLFFGTLQKRE